MAELVEADVTFVDPTEISAVSPLQIGLPRQNPANLERVIVAPESAAGGTKRSVVEEGLQSAASLTVTGAPGQPITILIDEVVAADGVSLVDFRCNYNAGGDTACDGPGYLETAVRNGTLLVGVTATGNGTAIAGVADGSFDVTITYQ